MATLVENYPVKFIVLSVSLTLITYFLGTLLIFLLNIYVALIFILVLASNVIFTLKFRCSFCYYYDKWCYTGFGKLASLIFTRGPSEEFNNPKNLPPVLFTNLLVLLVPIFSALLSLFLTFDLVVLGLLVLYLFVSTVPNFIIKPMMCKICKQHTLNCPVYKKAEQDIPLSVSD